MIHTIELARFLIIETTRIPIEIVFMDRVVIEYMLKVQKSVVKQKYKRKWFKKSDI